MSIPKNIDLRPSTLKDLSALYQVDPRTFRRWLKPFEKEIGPRRGYYFSIPQVKIIFRLLELPSTIVPREE